ncbi:MAG: hypothetical protein RLZZ216_901 [Cyanobacteriota bacterium]
MRLWPYTGCCDRLSAAVGGNPCSCLCGLLAFGCCRLAAALLHRLQLRNTGPAPALQLDLAPRLNLITGDNSLGKSFLLDVAWYCLTRRWPQELNPGLIGGAMAQPIYRTEAAEISFSVDGESDPDQVKTYQCTFQLEDEAWVGRAGRPVNPGLVVYAMADGAFAVWDPARNAWKRRGSVDTPEKTKAYVFSSRQVWTGLPNPQSELGSLCNGLIHDWASWQRENGDAYAQLTAVLKRLSPDPQRPMVPGPLVRISRQDSQDYPTLMSPTGQAVPLVHWSSGIKRIIGFAYLLVWAWQEHLKASELLAKTPARQMIVLVDEVEAHLHPTWQRRVVQSLMEVVEHLHHHTAVQLLLVTHSPLVMASVEPLFDPSRDRWWDLDWSDIHHQVELTPRPFARYGDANSWLRSEAFDQSDTGSLEREATLRRARQLMHQGSGAAPEQVAGMQTELQTVLGAADAFWNRWHFASRQHGWSL